jgi:hypothetical protein
VSFTDGELGVERAAQFRDHLRTCGPARHASSNSSTSCS